MQPVLADFERSEWRGVVRISVESRLETEDIEDLSAAILCRAGGTTSERSSSDAFKLTAEPRSELVSITEVKEAMAAARKRPLAQPIVAVRGHVAEAGVRTLIVARSLKDDHVMGKMLHEAVRAARQLRRDRPGIVAINTPNAIDWKAVDDAGVLQAHVSAVFRQGTVAKTAAVVFTSYGTGPHNAFVFVNPESQHALPHGFRLFGRAAE